MSQDAIFPPEVDFAQNATDEVAEPSADNNLWKVEKFLKARYEFRYNEVSNKVEWRNKGDVIIPFSDLRDYDYNSLLRAIKLADIQCSIQTLRGLLISNYIPKYNPYLDFRASLPEWDGRTDYIGSIASTVSVENPDFFAFCFAKWFVAMAVSWVNPEVVNHAALIISGEQGIGKTTWFKNLIPMPLKRYVYSGKINVADKDSQIKLSECPLLIMDELENMGRNVEALKELITKSAIYLRRAYGFTHENYVRRASFCGSTNDSTFLLDRTGNRRFLCFEAEYMDYTAPLPLKEAYAQAYALAANGFPYWFGKEEIALIEQNNQKFRVVWPEEEMLITYFEPCDPSDKGVLFMKTTDLLKSLIGYSGLRSLSDQKLGRVLSGLGYPRLKKMGRYVYAVKQREQIAEVQS